MFEMASKGRTRRRRKNCKKIGNAAETVQCRKILV